MHASWRLENGLDVPLSLSIVKPPFFYMGNFARTLIRCSRVRALHV